jgi:hypothetical protein
MAMAAVRVGDILEHQDGSLYIVHKEGHLSTILETSSQIVPPEHYVADWIAELIQTRRMKVIAHAV